MSGHLSRRLLSSLAISFASLLSRAESLPTFYRDIVPILQDHCQSCHRPGEIAPMPLVTYREVRPWAKAMRQAVRRREMPPWFAEPGIGRFSNDPSLSQQQIDTISQWAEHGAKAGDPKAAPPPRPWTEGWNIAVPTSIVSMPAPVSIPPKGDIEYTYEIVPTGFRRDTWVHMAEIRPSSRSPRPSRRRLYSAARFANGFARSGQRAFHRGATLKGAKNKNDARWTDSDILLVYAPGSSP